MQYLHPSYLTTVMCLECQHQIDYFPGLDACPVCGGSWLDARYDYAAVAQIWQNGLAGRVSSLWRYTELLPVGGYTEIVSMGEGFSPLVRANKLQQQLGHPAIFIKDERQSPTSSFKDRQAALSVTSMKQAGITECVLASTGNAAAAYSAYCARAGIKLWVFLTSLVPAAKMREAALYGSEVIKVTGTYDQAKKVADDFAVHRNIYLDKGAKSIPGKESMKTVAFEIAEELAQELYGQNGPVKWQAPDWYIQAVSGGIGPLGVLKGFEELRQMGLIDRVPKIGVVQVSGCAPMVQAFQANQPKAKPVVPETRITILSTGAPGLSYELLYQANQKYGGYMLSVTDDEAFTAMRHLAKTEGYSVEPATAVAFAGLDKLINQGIIKPTEIVVVNCSGHTFPVEKHIMDEENVLNVRLSQAVPGAPLDGLGSALEQLDEQVTTIVVIDDNPLDSRLIRRLLQARKPYRVFEANSAVEGLALVRERLPDLVVSDLAMPEMDGFALLEELKKDPKTANIPVIVVSAKDLTPEDEQKLAGQTSSIWLKGAFSPKALVEHVVDTLSSTDIIGSEPAPSPVVQTVKNAVAAAKTIVLVEDNPVDARLLSRILQTNLPVNIKHVHAGVDAVRVIRAERPGVIILDLMIPDKNGFQILEELRKDTTLDAIPVIVVTAKDLSAEEETLLQSNGVFSLWRKGQIDRSRLVAQIESQLEKPNKQQEDQN